MTSGRRTEGATPGAVGTPSSPQLSGTLRLRRVGWWRFPVYELVGDGDVVARLGRGGWLRIYFGRGQRIELAGGKRWRLRSVGRAGAICPVVVDAEGRRIAIAGIGHGTYGLNTRDDAYVFFPWRRDGRRRFILRRYEEEVAVFDRRRREMYAGVAVPLGVVVLCFTLARLGIPGESGLRVPSFRWGR